MRCPRCGGERFNSDGICLFCDYNMNPIKPTQDVGKVDIFKLAHGLSKKKREQEGLVIPRLSGCLWCLEHSLHYELKDDTFTCVNPKCAMFNKPILFNMREFKTIIDHLKKREH
jgi:hypothetical protein